jgi:hypothetical protein
LIEDGARNFADGRESFIMRANGVEGKKTVEILTAVAIRSLTYVVLVVRQNRSECHVILRGERCTNTEGSSRIVCAQERSQRQCPA